MRKKLLFTLLLAFSPFSLFSQDATSLRSDTKLATDPGACVVGQQYFNTTSNVQRICTALNTWSNASGAGSGITQLTGDGTAGPGSGSQALTLANTAVTPTTYGDATHVGQFTVDSKGRLTAASAVAITGVSGATTPVGLNWFNPTVSTSVLTINVDTTNGSSYKCGSKAYTINTNQTITLNASSVASLSNAWIYLRCDDGHIGVDFSSGYTVANVSHTSLVDCVGATTCAGGVATATGFPVTVNGSPVIPLYEVAAGTVANQWTSPPITSGQFDLRGLMGSYSAKAGVGLTLTNNTGDGTDTVALDRTLTPWYFTGTGAPGVISGSQVADLYVDTAAPALYFCSVGSAPCTTWVTASGAGAGSNLSYIPTVLCRNGGTVAGVQAIFDFWPIGPDSLISSASREPTNGPCILGVKQVVGDGISYNFIWPSNVTSFDVRSTHLISGFSAQSLVLTYSIGCLPSGSTFNSTNMTYGTPKLSSAYTTSTTLSDKVTAINIPAQCLENVPAKLSVKIDATSTGLNASDYFYFLGIEFVLTRTLP